MPLAENRPIKASSLCVRTDPHKSSTVPSLLVHYLSIGGVSYGGGTDVARDLGKGNMVRVGKHTRINVSLPASPHEPDHTDATVRSTVQTVHTCSKEDVCTVLGYVGLPCR